MEIRNALTADADGFLDSYPNKAWPADNMAAVAALARANAQVTVPGAAAAVSAWPARIARVRDSPDAIDKARPHRSHG